ncbi:MAG: PAS domain S-box protein [Acidobacteria bacterium]|nr:MAG: PAS domain S-box protein [Acidobacteriota bacterium]
MRPARSLFLFLLLPMAAGLIALSAVRGWYETRPVTGLTLGGETGDVRIVDVVSGSPAFRAGLAAGQRVLAISGQPVQTRLLARDLLERVPPGESVGLVVLDDGMPRSVTLETGRDRRLVPERVTATFVALVFLLGAVAVMLRPGAAAAVPVYAAWCLAGALLLGVTWTFRGTAVDWALYWVDRAARLAFPALWIHLVIALRRRGSRLRRWAPVLYAPPAALLLAEIHVVGLGGAFRAADPLRLVELLQSRIELAWIASGMLVGALLLVSATRSIRLRDRARAHWLIAGALLGVGPFVLVALVPRLVAGIDVPWGFAGLAFLALVPLTYTGAVLEYRLMDLALFVRRAVELLAALALSVVLFLGLARAGQLIVAPIFDPPGLIPVLIAALVTAALSPAIRAGTRALVGRLYYRRRYSFRRALRRVARDLNAERNLPELVRVIETRVTEALDAGVCRLLLVDGSGALAPPSGTHERTDVLPPGTRQRLAAGDTVTLAVVPDAPVTLPTLHRSGVQVLVPLRVEQRLIAVLAVGPRRGHRLLDSDDLDLLRSVCAHAAAAVAGAQHLAELERQVELVRRLQQRTEALIESSPMGMAVVDGALRVRHWNRALERLLDVAGHEALDRRLDEVFPPGLMAETRQAMDRARREGGARAYHVRVPDGDGDDRLINLSVAPLETGASDDALLLTLDDVTERVRLEQQLIQQDRLASVGLLAAGVAHEVNTPLTGISSYAQMLLDETAPDDPRRPLLERIVRQAERASSIARGLLSISRAGASPRKDEVREPVPLGELIEETIGLLGHQVNRAGAQVTTEIEPGRLVAWADRSRLQQVLMNLLLNALDAVEPGGRVTVRAGASRNGSSPDGGGIFIEVVDDGQGIAETIRDRIFDPFFTTKGPGRGTGLGLAISYSIVREHGGTLTADSTEGRGTTMRVELPDAGSAFREGLEAVGGGRAG